MGEELQRGVSGRVSWLRPSPDMMVDDLIDLTAESDTEPDDAVASKTPQLDRDRLFSTETDRIIGTGDPEPRGRVLGGKKRRRFLRSR